MILFAATARAVRGGRPGRRAGLCLLLLGALAAATGASAQTLDADAVRAQAAAPKSPFQKLGAKPAGPNPYLSFLPAEARPDYTGWQAWLRDQGKAKRALQAPEDLGKLIAVGESEPNDFPATADAVVGFGTASGADPAANVSGTIAPPPAPALVGPFAEDDGSIPLAVPLAVPSGSIVRTSGSIGDGPYGTTSGDFDFFQLASLAAGDEILIDVDTPMPYCCDLDPFVTIFDASGNLLAFNDDQPAGGTYDSYLAYRVPSAGTYYVVIGAYLSPFPNDRFDSSTGTGVRSTGTYDVSIGVNATDRDVFSFQVEPGDVVSANLVGASGMRLTLSDPSGVQRQGSASNVNFLLPGPFPQGGVSGLTYVAETPGTWTVEVGTTSGAYTLELRAFRPNLEQKPTGTAQTLFVDFDGATVDPSIFGGASGIVALSPLASFLADWGLTPADESALIDGILAAITESLSADMRVLALNGDYDTSALPGDFDLVLLNSRDHADPFGNPDTSRLVIGGTIAELGISTIGISQSIDPGNFSTSDTAVVLLDLLSAPASDPNSLNQFGFAGGLTKIDLVARGVGNVAAHEAGHFFAAFHTDQFDAQPNIMDQGGNLPNTVGVGPDLTLGTLDDVDVDFGPDRWVPNEGFTGIEDTLNATAFGLSTGTLGVCGDDILSPGEACDEGSANGTTASCCSASCTIASAGTACGTVAGACDAQEYCDGASPLCPADQQLPDGDGDGACDAIDPCTNPGTQTFAAKPKSVLVVGKINTDVQPGNDKLALSAAFTLPPGAPFGSLEIATTGARIVIEASGGAHPVDAVLPPGAYSDLTKKGWRQSSTGRRWTWYDDSGTPLSGITKVTLTDRNGAKTPRQVLVKVTASKGTYPVAPADAPLQAIVTLGGADAAADGICGESAFLAADCSFNGPANQVRCKR